MKLSALRKEMLTSQNRDASQLYSDLNWKAFLELYVSCTQKECNRGDQNVVEVTQTFL